ncbi:MAG: hypothetical protein AAF713_09835 [Pseudomonadota bacterium]
MNEPDGQCIDNSYAALLQDLRAAIEGEKMTLVTGAGLTEVAKKRGFASPGNRVLGASRNDFAIGAIGASVPAMIEAPIRFNVAEGDDSTATLRYQRPSTIFAPYVASAGKDLATVAAEPGVIFAVIAARAIARCAEMSGGHKVRGSGTGLRCGWTGFARCRNGQGRAGPGSSVGRAAD